jgi:anaerobic magnesium-protoporphyrin IX monomethyl ester cyclase
MKVVLNQAANLDDIREAGAPPIGLAYLSAYVKARESDFEFAYADTAEEILAHEPDLVGVSAVSQNSGLADSLARELRGGGYDGPLLVGGYHITGVPSSLSRDFDAGVLGEGEQTFLELLQLARKRGAGWKEDLGTVQGICFREGDAVVTTARRNPITPLDDMPHPDRLLLEEKWPPVHGGVHYVYSSRGCPYACSFCSSSQFWRGARFFSARYVFDELLDLAERYHAAHFFFYDDLFIADRQRVEQLSGLMCASGLPQEIESMCNVRASELDQEICGMLKDMNISWVYIGLESASDAVLQRINKQATVEQNVRALRLLKELGFSVTASFMLGMPGETADDMKRTAEFIERNLGTLFDEFMVYPVIPFPGTRIWRDAVSLGKVSENPPPETLRRATFTFHPDDYVYLNDAAPRDTFLFYLYYLRFMRLRHWLKRLLKSDQELGLMMGESVRQMDALKAELNKAGEYVAAVEGEIQKKNAYIRDLEAALDEVRRSAGA